MNNPRIMDMAIASMILLLIVAFTFFLLASPVLGVDEEANFPYGGDTELVVMYDLEYNHPLEISASSNQTNQSGGGGGENFANKYYDVVVNVIDTKIAPGYPVIAKVFVDFVPPFPPQQDGILQYTLVDPQGNELPVITRVVKEGDYLQDLSYNLPDDAAYGAWRFRAKWTVESLAPIISEDVFTVQPSIPLWPFALFMLLLFGAAIFLGMLMQKRKKQSSEDSA